MKRLFPLVLLLAAPGCDTATATDVDGGGGAPGIQDPVAAEVVIVSAVRGRQGTNVWWITPEFENAGGAGEFYLHLQGVAVDPEGPLTECGLTQKIDVPAGWSGAGDFVIECARAPQYITVYSRGDGESEFRVTDEFCY